MSERQDQDSVGSSVVLGIATGLLWAPCAGPILGIIFTAAALNGASFSTSLLLLAYALGAATSLALALLVGGKLFARMKKSLGASERIRQVLGVLVLLGVAAIALGLDTRVLSKLSSAQTASLESGLARKLGASKTDGRDQGADERYGRARSARGRISRRSPASARGSALLRSPANSFGAKSWSSISGPTAASTACARSPT